MDCYSPIKSSNGISSVSLDARLLLNRILFIEGEITAELACSVIKKVMTLVIDDPARPIDILINSPGGEINAGMSLYNLFQTCKTPIRLIAVGCCYSMGAVLFASGKNGRYMLDNASLMLHQPLLANHVTGNSSSIKSISDSLMETKRQMNRLLSKHTEKSERQIEKATSYDHYFNPQEAIDFGLCDGVIGFDQILGAYYENR